MKRKKRISAKFKARAVERHKALWEYYDKHGIMYLKDFKQIAQGQYGSIVETLKTYGLECPPVYDSRQEQYRRKAEAIIKGAKELGRDTLTVKETAKILGVKPCEVANIETRLKRAGHTLPEIVMDEDRGNDQFVESRQISEWAGRINGVCNPLYHPQGLQVLTCWEGPGKGEVTYLLR